MTQRPPTLHPIAVKIRRGQAPDKLSRPVFGERYEQQFYDPAFDAARESIARVEEIAWDAYHAARKSPRTQAAGEGFSDPRYQLSLEWLETRRRLRVAATAQAASATPSRVLLVNGSARNDGSCPSEMSKSHRLVEIAKQVVTSQTGYEADVLDLSLLTSEYGKNIHPCKACVSTAMPLCHWPCSCYPNHSLGQTQDWMAEIYERWTAAHGVMIVTPVYWYQAPSVLKLMIDRLVCADGGNPDPSSTQGKDPKLAKSLELKGWDYPQHLKGRAYGIVTHGDAAGTESLRRGLDDWLSSMGLVDAGALAKIDRYIGYYGPYATSHDALDDDEALQEEVRNVARAVVNAVRELRNGRTLDASTGLTEPRKK